MGAIKGPVVNGVVQINQRVKFMREVQSGLFYPWSNNWYVDQDNGSNDYSGRGPSRSKATILAAEAAMAARDTIFLRPGSTDHPIAAAIDFNLNDISVIGLSRNRFQPHVDLAPAYTTTMSPMLTFSGRGGYFANMTIRHGSETAADSGTGYATDLTCALISGRYNMFDNVYFYTPLYAEQDVAATYKGVQVTGHNNYFYQCKFGSDGLNRDQANWNLAVEGGIGNVFEECIFQMGADGTAPFFVRTLSTARDMKYTIFKKCIFYAHSANYGTTPSYAFDTDYQANTAGVILDNCNFVNVGQISDANKDSWIWKAMYEGENGADTTKIGMIALRNQGV